MKNRVMFWIKLCVLLSVLGFVGYKVYFAWHDLSGQKLSIDWSYSPIALCGFAGVMLTSGVVWRWLARRMGDRGPFFPLVGAYTFSQMGKYVPGKVMLLLMRIERAARFGMTPGICTLSTLLENALYMVSGGLVGMIAIAKVAHELPNPSQRALIWPVTIVAVVGLASACHPAIFYRLVNGLLVKMKRPPVPPEERLRMGTLALGVLAFVPCWLFGGLALWASASALHPIPLADCVWFAGAFALSVIIGMASLLPGGLGVREAVLGAAVVLALSNAVGHSQAVIIAAAAALLQRLFQIVVEVVLGVGGALLTTGGKSIAERSAEGFPVQLTADVRPVERATDSA